MTVQKYLDSANLRLTWRKNTVMLCGQYEMNNCKLSPWNCSWMYYLIAEKMEKFCLPINDRIYDWLQTILEKLSADIVITFLLRDGRKFKQCGLSDWLPRLKRFLTVSGDHEILADCHRQTLNIVTVQRYLRLILFPQPHVLLSFPHPLTDVLMTEHGLLWHLQKTTEHISPTLHWLNANERAAVIYRTLCPSFSAHPVLICFHIVRHTTYNHEKAEK